MAAVITVARYARRAKRAVEQVEVVSDVGILYAVVGTASILAVAVAFAGVLRQPPIADAETGTETAQGEDVL